MKLTISAREVKKKGEINALRREKKIPAILYSKEKPCEPIVVDSLELSAILRKLKPGHLPTTVFTLTEGKKERRAIIKDIQRHVTSYEVSHIDFEELIEGESVSVKVPINCTGVAECAGVKLGGFLRQVVRHVKVECLPKVIPSEFVIDVKDLGIRQTRRLSDLEMPKGVKPLARLEEVIVVVAKK
jgi:large subunit ribosomal protein L25